MYHSEVGRCENRSMKSMDLIIFFGQFWWYISLESNCIRIMVSQWFWDEFAITDSSISWWISAENHQADRLIDVNLPLIPPIWGVWPSIMTTIVDWVMTLGFFGKKAWEKKFMARFFRRKVMAFPDFFLSNFLRFRYWTFTRSGWDCPAQQLDQREGEFGGI